MGRKKKEIDEARFYASIYARTIDEKDYTSLARTQTLPKKEEMSFDVRNEKLTQDAYVGERGDINDDGHFTYDEGNIWAPCCTDEHGFNR